MTFKPMLSATVKDHRVLTFPLLASPKLDGVRAIVRGGALVSRNLKPIPNAFLQKALGRKELEGLDGELIMGEATDSAAFRSTTSAVMSREGEPREVKLWVFDLAVQQISFKTRLDAAMELVQAPRHKHLPLAWVPHKLVHNHQALDDYEAKALEAGYEGVMLRAPDGVYKHGRSTMLEHGLMKLKRFADAEAKVVGVDEQMHNGNEAVANKLGQLERSSRREGLKGKGTLGALRVVGINGPYKGVEFGIGTGFDDRLRSELWRQAFGGELIGQVVKYKYFATGSKDAPRFPVYLGMRHANDA
jgi:DNA ligase-1